MFSRSIYGNDTQHADNLHDLRLPSGDGPHATEALENNAACSADGSVEVLFQDIQNRLVQEIRQADAVVGCVAWLTNRVILNALRECQAVAVVVQKEDFLKPDLQPGATWVAELRHAYGLLPWTYRGCLGMAGVSSLGEPTVAPVRCVGNHNSERKPSWPRMHNKFLLFCKEHIYQGYEQYEPYAAWTGSYNLSHTAEASFENAVLLRDKAIVDAYMNEFRQIAILSEPLDWEHPWVTPEWRLGT